MKRPIHPVNHKFIQLRLLKEEDLRTTLDWRNNEEIRKWFKTVKIITSEEHRNWFHSYQSKDNDFVFIMEIDDKPIGQASIYNIDYKEKSAEIGRFIIKPEEQGKGYFKECIKAIFIICTEQLNLINLRLEVLKNNTRALSTYVNFGFEIEKLNNEVITMTAQINTKSAKNIL